MKTEERSRPLVSIVTPFHNTADFLEQCIKSVLAQTHGHFEYILVDNHSTDDGRAIAERFAGEDDRIRLVSPPTFLSQCDNFNFALNQISATSTYCKMVLADDWLYPQCIAEMTVLAEAHPSVGLVSSYTLADTALWGAGLSVEDTVMVGRDAARKHLIDGLFLFGNNSTVMYRSDIVRQSSAFYRESSVFFDTDAALRILRTHDFGFIHQVLSYLRVHDESITIRTRDFGPIAADHMIALHNHGPIFLSPEELKSVLRPTVGWFYEGLGRQRLRELFSESDREYWDYQRWCLGATGQQIRRLPVWRGAARSLALSAISPVDQLRRLKRRLHTPLG